MKHILSMIVIFMTLSVMTAQESIIDNQVWQSVDRAPIFFRIPSSWDNFGNTWESPDNAYRVRYILDEDYDSLVDTIFSEPSLVTEEIINLPIGDITRLSEPQKIAYMIPIDDAFSAIVGDSADEISDMLLIAQIANTLALSTPTSDDWSLYATNNANLFLRVPSNWMQQSSTDDSLTLTETFDDVSVSVRYRNLGRDFVLSEIEDQFQASYRTNGYDIQEQTTINLPSGDALFFRLGDVPITEDVTHSQWHFVIARDNYMIVLVASGNQGYFEEYAAILTQIVDTFQFIAPQ